VRTIPEQREEEFRELERVAMQYLIAPHSLPKAEDIGRWIFRLRLWHYPSFSECVAWGLYQRHERGSRQVRSLVRQVTWSRPSDVERFMMPLKGLEQGFHTQPTIEVRDRPLDSADLDARIEELGSITFPPFAARGVGIDGETFGVAYPNHGASVEWWCEGPESWSDLTLWASRMRNWLCLATAAEPCFDHWAPPRPRLP
jgi:hypothetical protein